MDLDVGRDSTRFCRDARRAWSALLWEVMCSFSGGTVGAGFWRDGCGGLGPAMGGSFGDVRPG